MFKNVASQKIQLFAFDTTTGLPKTGDAANITAYVSKDYGAVTVLGDTSATEEDSTNAKGCYIFDLTQAETNADTLRFSAKSSTANISIVTQTVYTFPASFTSFITPSNLTAAQIATGIWQDTTAGDFTTALSVGKSVMNGVSLGTGLTVAAVSGAVGSVTGAVGSVTGAVGSVTGNVGGNVVGSVASVTAGVTLAASAVQAIWDALTSALTTVGSIGKLLVDNINATISSRLASASYTAPTNLTAAQIATGVWQDATAGDFTAANSIGKSIMNGVALGTGLTVNDITTKTGYSLSGAQTFNNTGTWTGNIVGTLSTLTTYTGNTPQTGDAYAALTGAQAEPGQGAPAVNASPLSKVSYLYKAWRNKHTQTATEYDLYADDAATVDQKAAVSDDATTFSRGEIASGP